MKKRRRIEHKTDYRFRLHLLKSGKGRVVFRKTNRYIIGQFIESKAAQDRVLIQANSKELLGLGWPQDFQGSLKSLPACFLTGILLGKRIKERFGNADAVFDIGLLRNIPKSRMYAFLKGISIEIKIPLDAKVLPGDDRVNGSHVKKDIKKIIENVMGKIAHE